MKVMIISIVLTFIVSANAANLVVRVVEEGVKGFKDIKVGLQSKEQTIWEKAGWKCGAFTVDKEKVWGLFRCDHSSGLEVSSRFNCEKQKSFEDGRAFRIAKKEDLSATFSFWCE